jgi:histidinol dehydrogenase
MKTLIMQTIINPPRDSWKGLSERPLIENTSLEKDVRDIMEEVRSDGDKALRKFSSLFDSADPGNFRVPGEEIINSGSKLDSRLRDAMNLAAKNIEAFHQAQVPPVISVSTMPGVLCSQKWLPVERVGLYIPGGTAPLFSTVLMLGIPARIAGCREVILCTPPGKQSAVHPAILYAAHQSGIQTIFSVGGAQAIAAMTFGTETIPAVDKIFGPGNQWVTMAKQIAASHGTAIDLPAGPSEVAIIADKSVPANFIAADLLSQAEHGTDSQVLLATTDGKIVDQVKMELERLLFRLPRVEITRKALESCKIIVFENYDLLMDFINTYAPEHLIIATENYRLLKEKVVNAGSVFLGNYTPESAGDYASGTNHTLPTNGFARAWSGVGTDSFMKKISFQEITADGLEGIGQTIEFMAAAEDLEAHRQAVRVRLDFLNSKKNAKWDQSIH